MRLPFVSRALYTELRDRADREIALLTGLLQNERTRTAYLTDQLLDMKVAGGTVIGRAAAQIIAARGPNGTEPTRVPKPTRSAVSQAIDENRYASSNPALRRHLENWARKEIELTDGSDDAIAKIITRLKTWSSPAAVRDDDDTADELIELED